MVGAVPSGSVAGYLPWWQIGHRGVKMSDRN
jgi:hypothetical protein